MKHLFIEVYVTKQCEHILILVPIFVSLDLEKHFTLKFQSKHLEKRNITIKLAKLHVW